MHLFKRKLILGILADDMGLGKTLIVIALIMSDRKGGEEETLQTGNEVTEMETEDNIESNQVHVLFSANCRNLHDFNLLIKILF
jgi:SNF2 family DNA or RNA helicase